MDKMNIYEQIIKIKKELGNRIVIPAHHYQNPEIVELADFVGDSYKLAVDCSKVQSEFIIFCGVYFMAEAADILSNADQKVILPDISARCPMADQINFKQAEEAFRRISELTKKQISPVVYMNSNAEVKSFCGQNGGAVCTSSNAAKIVQHYLDQGKVVFFFPDFNLGINTARELNLKENEIIKVTKDFDLIGDPSEAKMFLWDGFCYVHKRFQLSDIDNLRGNYPKITIIVHPECDEQVVKNSDISGSTSRIYNEIKKSSSGSIWGVGTEYHFIQRIAAEFSDKIILPLKESICSDMALIKPDKLLKSLQQIQNLLNRNVTASNKTSSQNIILERIVQVDEHMKLGAAKALKKMIEIVEN